MTNTMQHTVQSSRFPDDKDVTHFISLGAGVQSTTLYLMAAHGLIEPAPAAAIFADTGWEPPDIYEHLEWLKTISLTLPVPVPIYVINGGNLYDDVWNHRNVRGIPFNSLPAFTVDKKGKEGIGRRECTLDYKIRPIRKQIAEQIGRPANRRHAKPPFAVQWLGISQDEWHRIKDSTIGWLDNAYPLVDMRITRASCLAWFGEHYPNRPLVKSACVGCPYRSNVEWLRLYREFPDEMEKAIALDKQMRSDETQGKSLVTSYLHRSYRPLDAELKRLDTLDRQSPRLLLDDADGFGNECEGHCGV